MRVTNACPCPLAYSAELKPAPLPLHEITWITRDDYSGMIGYPLSVAEVLRRGIPCA